MTKARKQCAKCPWRVGVDPNTIPNGYCRGKHAALRGTIASADADHFGAGLNIMACHETPVGAELPCVGWLANQMGTGGNIPLRLAVATGQINGDVETVGEQHASFELTLPTCPEQRSL